MHGWAWALIGAIGGLVILWLVLVAIVWITRPNQMRTRDMMRLLPDLIRLIHRLAADDSLPRGVRVRLWLLLGYLASPIDLVPDFIPIIGYADDVIVAALVLRSTVRRAGSAAVTQHWPGTPEGLDAVQRLIGTQT